jgi:hypothetical protein
MVLLIPLDALDTLLEEWFKEEWTEEGLQKAEK